ncbi:MAG: CoA pyrophosphatase [Rubrivivax sp.]|nr:CoA pyrophosphatase [Rubrivivax sp.]
MPPAAQPSQPGEGQAGAAVPAKPRLPTRILDPRLVPVAGHDAHLPAITPERLRAEALRERFARARPFTPEMPGDGGRFHLDRAVSPAAVLVPLVQRPEGLSVLLTRRTEHLRDHAGQISFPGGRAEADDANAADTALREAEEEVGLARRHVELIGELPLYHTVTSYAVTPVVGLVTPPFELALDPFEVAEAFEVPLAFLMTPAHHRRHHYAHEGIERQFFSMPWQGGAGDGPPREYFIWGATAAMLRNLYRYLAG